MTIQQVSTQLQDQGQLIQSLSSMGQQIVMLQLALQRQYQQHQEEKREFIKKFTEYRKGAENRIFNIQNTCAQTILGIMRLRIQDNNAQTVEEIPQKQISVLEHQIQIKQTLTQGQQVLQHYKLKAETEFQDLIQQNNGLKQQVAQLQQFNESLKLAIGESGKTISELKKSLNIIRQNSENQIGQLMGRVTPTNLSQNHSIASKQSYKNLFSRKKSFSIDRSVNDDDTISLSLDSFQPSRNQQRQMHDISIDLKESNELCENQSEIQNVCVTQYEDKEVQTDQETTFAIEDYIQNSLSQYKELNFQFKKKENANYPDLMSSSILPWVVAAQTASRIIVDNHAKVLVENDNLRAQVTKALFKMRQVQSNDHIIVKLQTEIKQLQSANEQQLKKINDITAEKDNIVIEKQKKYDEMEQNLNMQIAGLKTELKDIQFKYNEAQKSLNQAKQIFMEEFTAKYKLSESQAIGELSRKIVYLESVQSMFTSAEVEHKNQIKHLENANAELRMYQFKFNDKLINMKQILTAQIQEQFNPYLQSLQDQKKTMNDEYELMQEEIQQLKHENNTLRVQSNDLSYTLERVQAQQKVYQQQLKHISGLNNNYYSVNLLLRRKIEQYITEKYRLKDKINGMMQLILNLQQETINIEHQSRFITETLIQRLYERIQESGASKQQSIRQIQAFIDDGLPGGLDSDLKNQITYAKAGSNLQYLSIIQLERLNVSNENVIRNSFEERFYDDFDAINTVLVNNEQQTNVVSSYDKAIQVTKNKVFVKDFSQSVKFYYGESQLLQDAYKQIEEYKALLEQKNETQENLASFKDRVFRECYAENIQMVERTERQLDMMHEDLLAQNRRFKDLVHWRDTHHCPTIEDFQPQFNKELDKLRTQKDSELQKASMSIQRLQILLKEKDQQLDALAGRYTTLKDALLTLKQEDFYVSHPELTISLQKLLERLLSIQRQIQDNLPMISAKLQEAFVLRMERGMETEPVHVLTDQQFKQLQRGQSRVSGSLPGLSSAQSSRGSSKALLRRPSTIKERNGSASPENSQSATTAGPGVISAIGSVDREVIQEVSAGHKASKSGSRRMSRQNSEILHGTTLLSRQNSQKSAKRIASRRNSMYVAPHRTQPDNEAEQVTWDDLNPQEQSYTQSQAPPHSPTSIKSEHFISEEVEECEVEEEWCEEMQMQNEMNQEGLRILTELCNMQREEIWSQQLRWRDQQGLFQYLLGAEQRRKQAEATVDEMGAEITSLNQQLIEKGAELRALKEQLSKVEQSLATLFSSAGGLQSGLQSFSSNTGPSHGLQQGLASIADLLGHRDAAGQHQNTFGSSQVHEGPSSAYKSSSTSQNQSRNPSQSKSPLSKPISISKRVRGMLRPENQYKMKAQHQHQQQKSADEIVEQVLNKKNSRDFIQNLIERQQSLQKERNEPHPEAPASVIEMHFQEAQEVQQISPGDTPGAPEAPTNYRRPPIAHSVHQTPQRPPPGPKVHLTPSQQKAELIKAKHQGEKSTNQMLNQIRRRWQHTKEILDKSAIERQADTSEHDDTSGTPGQPQSISEQLADIYDTYGLSQDTPKYVRKARPVPHESPEEHVKSVISKK